jgi:hypothetical protein
MKGMLYIPGRFGGFGRDKKGIGRMMREEYRI